MSVSTTHTKTKWISMLTQKPIDSNFAYNNLVKVDHLHKNQVNRSPHQKRFILGPHAKPSRFWPPHKNKSISIPSPKTCQIRSQPDTKTKLISIQTLNQVLFDPHTNQTSFDPYTEIKSISISKLKPCHFRPVLLCVLFIRIHVAEIQQQYGNTYYINMNTSSYWSCVSILQ